MWIRLAVEHTEHQTFADVLRVHGIIEEAPFDVGLTIRTRLNCETNSR